MKSLLCIAVFSIFLDSLTRIVDETKPSNIISASSCPSPYYPSFPHSFEINDVTAAAARSALKDRYDPSRSRAEVGSSASSSSARRHTPWGAVGAEEGIAADSEPLNLSHGGGVRNPDVPDPTDGRRNTSFYHHTGSGSPSSSNYQDSKKKNPKTLSTTLSPHVATKRPDSSNNVFAQFQRSHPQDVPAMTSSMTSSVSLRVFPLHPPSDERNRGDDVMRLRRPETGVYVIDQMTCAVCPMSFGI